MLGTHGSTAQSPTNGIMGTHPIQAPCSVVDTYCKDIAEDTYKAHGGALTTLDFGVGALPSHRRRIALESQNKRARPTRVRPREPTLLRLYLAHFFPV
eukprot:COSAG04_NODE_3282_length_2976_cov_62.648245_3_plen_97_part_01